jgi:hypothetical protein
LVKKLKKKGKRGRNKPKVRIEVNWRRNSIRKANAG